MDWGSFVPKLTPQQLQEAKRKKAEEAELAQRRQEERLEWLRETRQRHTQVSSAADGLYEEMDKLGRKWPNMPASKLTIEKVNKVIAAAKDFMKDEQDDFAADIAEFIPAGDDIETRDVVLTLSEVKQALDRFKKSYQREWQNHLGY